MKTVLKEVLGINQPSRLGALAGASSTPNTVKINMTNSAPENPAAAVAELTATVRTELAAAKTAVAATNKADHRKEREILWALSAVHKLHGLLGSSPAKIYHPGPVPLWGGMPLIGMPGYEIAQLILLIFPSSAFKPATLIGYFNILRLAEREKISPSDFRDFIQRHGGLTSCAKLATKQMERIE